MTIGKWMACSLIAVMFFGGAATCGEINMAEWEAMKKELAEMKRENSEIRKTSEDMASKLTPIKSSVDKALDGKMGPGAVVTKAGKLTITGLTQVWYYQIDNDRRGLFTDDQNDILDPNEAADNDSFRIRRADLKFTLDIHPNIRSVVSIDLAREAQGFANLPVNTGTLRKSTLASVANVQGGAGAAPRALKDAFILYHSKVPHHDFQIGQFKPAFGEEGIRSSSQLDFVERSFAGSVGDLRDTGIQMRGYWYENRLQYWLGAFNTAGNFHTSGGQQQNRGDDNDAKDVFMRILGQPLKSECYGNLELGYSVAFGTHGEHSLENPTLDPGPGINRPETNAIKQAAWFQYYAPGAVRGWWVKGEWASIKDRHVPEGVIDFLDNDLSGNGLQDIGKAFRTQGFYVATGYKIMDSCFSDDCPSWFKGLEFAARYDTFDNVHVANVDIPNQTDTFKTVVYTAGINYYIKGHNAKIQLNYNIVDDPEGDNRSVRSFHQVQNNNLMMNFQVGF